jgi:hypothetical protein
MRSVFTHRVLAVTVIVVGIASCSGSHPAVSASHTAQPAHATHQPTRYPARIVTMADAAHCPVTIGHTLTTPWRQEMFGWGSAAGNGKLWVGGLWPRGIIVMTPGLMNPDGAMGMKFGWWRATSGYLTITGRRLDAPAPAATGDTSPGSYGLTGFNASGVTFPTEGCWQVTGRVGAVTFTFVTFVIKAHG